MYFVFELQFVQTGFVLCEVNLKLWTESWQCYM